MKIVPAILTENQKDLKEKIALSETFCDYAQIDIMDGKFVPSRSVSAADFKGLQTSLKMEIHLMVKDPLNYIADFKKIGASRIIFHFESEDNPEEVIKKIKDVKIQPGLALNPETAVSAVQGFLGDLDALLVLTVNPGFYGSNFIPECLNKIKEIKQSGFRGEVGIDGGINKETLSRVLNIGLDYVCVGSAIFAQSSPGEAFRGLSRIFEKDYRYRIVG